MTTVEWLVNEINNQKCWADPARIEIIIQYALIMEKQQIIDAYDRGYDIGAYGDVCEPEKYFNETYKKDNQ